MMRRTLVPCALALPLTLTLTLTSSSGCIVLPGEDSDTDVGGSDGGSGDAGDADDPSASGGMDGAGDTGGSGGSDSDSATSDTGVEPTERAVDIVFVVDNSGSMGEEQAKLARDIDALVDALDAAVPPVDYRIAVTTTDNGNPWCQGTGSEAGTFRATSCRTRTEEFVFQGAEYVDITEEACLAVCDQETLGLSESWIDVERSTGTTNVPGDDVKAALGCMLPQGIDGCGFEQPLESLSLALQRAQSPGDLNEGFLRPGALLAVAVVTDEVDCSTNPTHDTIFLPEGNRVFWSDPDSPAPSSAVCWNAGVHCSGPGPYDCFSVQLDVDGHAVAGDPDSDAVLRPLSGYVDDLQGRGAFVTAINGVAADGAPVYDDSPADPQFQQDFGIGAGCSSPSGEAVPPVRMRELVDTVSGSGNLHSICAESFAPALSSMAAGILARLPS